MRAWNIRQAGVFALGTIVLLALPVAYALKARSSEDDPAAFTERYLAAVYARDYRAVYPLMSAADRKNKSEEEFLRENPSFTGPALEMAHRLARMVEFGDVRAEARGDRVAVRFAFRAPDANQPALRQVVLDFDSDRLAHLSENDKRAITQKLDAMHSRGALPMIEGQDALELVREDGGWRVFNNWSAGVRVRFKGEVREGLPWEFRPLQEIVLAKPGETLQAVYEAKNLSDRPVTAKALHIDRPAGAEKYLEIIQCFCFIRETLKPGETKRFPLTFRVKDPPPDVKELEINYQFYPLGKFPETKSHG